jgi:hypothetical protein
VSATDDVTFKIGNTTYPFVFPDKMSFPEQRELKRMSGGMTPSRVFSMLQEMDPDAWCSVMIVCMRRVDPGVKDNALDKLDYPMELAVAVLGAYDEAAKADAVAEDDAPLLEAASAAEPEPEKQPAISSTPTNGTEPATTPEVSGVPA